MATSSPETYKGLLSKAAKLCEETEVLVSKVDADGFINLVRWNDIDQAVEKLSEMNGFLEAKIKELPKNSPRLADYKAMKTRIENSLSSIRKTQRMRNGQ